MVYKRILVAFDGSAGSWKAMRKGISIAKDQDAELVALSVEDSLPHYAATVGDVAEEAERQSDYVARIQAEGAALARQQGLQLATVVLVGHPAANIVRYAQEHSIDLIIVGQSGHSGIRAHCWAAQRPAS